MTFNSCVNPTSSSVIPQFSIVHEPPFSNVIPASPLLSFPRKRESSYGTIVIPTFYFVIPAKAGIQNMQYYVYILASKRNGALYTGVTNDLVKRVYEHKNDLADGFTKKYGIHQLVYFEQTGDVNSAIAREKQLKNWHRQWKLELIEEKNPEWKDLYQELL